MSLRFRARRILISLLGGKVSLELNTAFGHMVKMRYPLAWENVVDDLATAWKPIGVWNSQRNWPSLHNVIVQYSRECEIFRMNFLIAENFAFWIFLRFSIYFLYVYILSWISYSNYFIWVCNMLYKKILRCTCTW